jgi:hypothetical protein
LVKLTNRKRLLLESGLQIANLDSLEGKDGKTVHKALHTVMVGHNGLYAQ